jgi:hypothetical protein
MALFGADLCGIIGILFLIFALKTGGGLLSESRRFFIRDCHKKHWLGYVIIL